MSVAAHSKGASPLDPPLPYDMKPAMARAVRDLQLQQFVNSAAHGKHIGRMESFDAVFGDDYDDIRRLAGRIKQHALDHLDVYLERFAERAREAGAQIHFANDAEQANAICLDIAKRHDCKLCVKSKSMVTEETHLLPALQGIGVETIETDLGEFIIQLDGDAPSHIVTPMIHKDRRSVARAFQREIGAAYTEDPRELTGIAREYLRRKFASADLGISGGNFLIAETGSLVLCTNEGNGGLSVTAPPLHVAFVGIEKVVPRLQDLGVFLKLLARSSTAQPLTVYTSVITGPRRPPEHDGPNEVHIILIDNGRSEILRGETRELLRCIRCGACLNACPVYRKVGGHAYGAVYSGPIGAAITPLFKGLRNYADLPQASSLCGACYDACPVHIDIPRHLIRLRSEIVAERVSSRLERAAYRLWAVCLRRPLLYRLTNRLQRFGLRLLGGDKARTDSTDDRCWISRAPPPLRAWTSERDFPTPTSHSFRDWWRREREEGRP